MRSISRGLSHMALSVTILLSILLGSSGCRQKSTTTHADGRLWVLNNLCAYTNYYPRWLIVNWEGQEIDIPNNMDMDGRSTGAGAVQIGPELLLGGTVVDFVFTFQFIDEVRTKSLSEVLQPGQEAIIDGDITIDIHSLEWNTGRPYNDCTAAVISGRCDDIHHYPEL